MVATVTKFTLTATLVCVVMLCGHGSLQMPTQARTKRASICDRKLQTPNVERDLLLGLRTMYLRIFNGAKTEVDRQNLTIEIDENSTKFQTVSNSICSFMMYSDFLEASSSTKNSTKLQALRSILHENIRDGCTLLKNQSAVSDQVNFTTTATQQPTEGNSGISQTSAECSNEDLERLRVHCLEQSLLQQFVREPTIDIDGVVDSDCLNKKGECSWVERHFQEPERSIIVEQASLPCSASK